MKWTTVIFTGFFSIALSSQGEVVYQSDFTGTSTNLADYGLQSTGAAGGLWKVDTGNDRIYAAFPGGNYRATVRNIGGFQSSAGFTLDVTFNQLATSAKFSIGLVDLSGLDWNYGNDFIQDTTANKPYSIGFSTDGALENANGDKDVLSFYNGSTTSKLSDAQGDITFGQDTRLVLTITADSWSYSLNGAPATTGPGSFDMSKSYGFVAYGNNSPMNGSYISNITLIRNESNPGLSGIVATDSGLVISWDGKTGETYTVDRTTNLLMTLFGGITNGIPGVEPLTVYTDSVSSIPEAFYRVIKE